MKSPKLYFTDTGLASFLCGFQSPAALAASAHAGAFWENHVICQWLRWRDWRVPAAGLWYWQDRMKNEVDLVVELDGRLHPIDCKRKERPDTSDPKGLNAFRSFYAPDDVGPAWIACLAERRFEVAPGVTAANGWRAWTLSERGER